MSDPRSQHAVSSGPPPGLLDDASLVRLETPDLDGLLRGKFVTASKFVPTPSAIMFTEAYLALAVRDEVAGGKIGSAESGYGDLVLRPDWSTATPAPGTDGVVTVLCDGYTKAGESHPVHPRSLLRRITDELAADGFEAKFGVEFEFWVFRVDDATREALRDGRMSDLTPSSRLGNSYSLARWPDCADYFYDLCAAMAALGAPLEMVMAEMGQGMFEAAIGPLPPVEAADAAARFKLMARELAAKHGLLVSFMAKLKAGESGSSGHVHQSLTHDGENVIWNGQEGTLSTLGEHYLAGLLKAIRECGVVMAPFPNSYRRFNREFFAPDSASWAYDNRLACVRAITHEKKSSRFELRRPGADLQPYLTIAASLAGGRWGLRTEAVPPAASVGACEPSPGSELATTLPEAIALFDQSELARESFGDDLVDAYVALRSLELDTWTDLNNSNIPDWELARYLEVV